MRSLRVAPLLLVSTFALGACGTVSPSGSPATSVVTAEPSLSPTTAGPSPTPRAAADVYAEIRAQVIQIRGLTPTKSVDPVSIGEDQLRTNLTADFDRE